MYGFFTRGSVIRVAQRLAINRHNLFLKLREQGLDPSTETVLEMRGRDPGEDAAEGVMGRNAVGQRQKGF